MNDWAYLTAGGLLLYFGAEWFVAGASSLALALRVPQLLVGLTVVAYGTSAPEVIVGVQAARSGHGDVALGNVIGSNVVNIGLILGVAALVRPARVDGSLRVREVPVLLGSALLVPLLLLDGRVSTSEGAGLVLTAAAYTLWMIPATRSGSATREAREDAAVTADAATAAGAPPGRGRASSLLITVAGLFVLLIGGHIFVDAAVHVARTLAVDLGLLVVMTVLAAVFVRTERTISHLEGGVALGLYVAATV